MKYYKYVFKNKCLKATYNHILSVLLTGKHKIKW